jgi:molybdate transport system substrate-binding protein
MTRDCLEQPTLFRRIAIAAVVAVAALTTVTAQKAGSRTVAVAAASDLQTVLPALLSGFEKATAIKARVSFGSSGNFFAQIQNGAPFDVFFSADVDYPRRLVAAGQADADSLYQYATGRLVLWTRSDSGVDVRKGLAVLRDSRVRRIVIANPDLAPYGRAAVAALKTTGVYDQIRDKLVFGENISQAAQLAQSGNADVGLLAHSLASGAVLKASGTFIDIPSTAYPPVAQAAVLVSASRNKDAGRALLQYIKSAEARQTFADFGFGEPPRP